MADPAVQPPPLTGPLAEALARGRDRFNSSFEQARKASRHLDAGLFMDHLATVVDPVIRAVADRFPERVDMAAAGLYDVSLVLFNGRLLGPDALYYAIPYAWQHLFPTLGTLMARDAGLLAGSISNALVNLSTTRGTRPDLWIQTMIQAGPLCPSVEVFLECGKVAAWRTGMAQYRTGALAAARTLDPVLAGLALRLEDQVTRKSLDLVLDRLAADPWLPPEDALWPMPPEPTLQLVATIGDFRGFGGPFLRPPTVCFCEGQLIFCDGEATWRLIADRFGQVLIRIDPPTTLPRAWPGLSMGADGKISWDSDITALPPSTAVATYASDGRTLAVTQSNSHRIILLARTAAST